MFALAPLILIIGSAIGINYIVRPKLKEIKGKENLADLQGDFWHLIFPEFFVFLDSAEKKLKTFRHIAAVDYEKFLRKLRILSLRTDNFVNKLLEKRQRRYQKPEFEKSNNSSNDDAVSVYFKTRENNLIAEIAKNPKDKNLYKALGVFYLENQMLSDAQDVFNVVLELDPNDSEAKENIEKITKIR